MAALGEERFSKGGLAVIAVPLTLPSPRGEGVVATASEATKAVDKFDT